jgi:cytochrome c-type protein NapB
VIPHPTHMRENCESCHGVAGPHGLRTPHAERQSCTQCHAPDAKLDRRPTESFPPWVRPDER